MGDTGGGEITQLLRKVSDGDQVARDRLFQAVYPDLKRMAIGYLARERNDHTLQPTALVNEAFLRIPASDQLSFADRSHFLAVASNAMRRILVDHARARLSQKRGKGLRVELNEAVAYDPQRPEIMVDLDNALLRLEAMNPRQARVVEMRFFGGLSEDQIADVLQVSSRTVKRDWQIARAWLFGELSAAAASG